MTSVRIETEAEKRKLLENIVAAQEAERERISLELHDELGQQVTAIRLKIKAVDEGCGDAPTKAEIATLIKMAAEIDSSISFIARRLRPGPLKDKAFVTAVKDYVSLWTRDTGILVTLSSDGLRDASFGSKTESHLFRILQESLNNALKHAKAESVEILFTKREGENVMIIMDDGCGFAVDEEIEKSDGLGLPGMCERAQIIGGSCEIESTPGEGTTIYITFPDTADSRKNAAVSKLANR